MMPSPLPRWFLARLALVMFAGVTVSGAPQAGAAQTAPAPGGRGGQGFPAQQRPPGDPAVVDRGRQIYSIQCRACHGADLRGGDMGGPNLLRSSVALNDVNGELLQPIIRGSRANAGMPAIELPADDVNAVAAYVRSILATSRPQGAPPAGAALSLNVLTGDANAGQMYFNEMCSSCHSITGDLRGIATRISDPMLLQNWWVAGGRTGGSGRGGEPDDDGPAGRRTVTATVTPASGPAVQGRLERIDDFAVTLILSDGSRRTFRRVGEAPKIQINDPLARHKALLSTYSDTDMHNVTAYLMTLK